jgi:hypothetical protein
VSAVRSRDPEFVIVRASRVPPGVIEELKGRGLGMQRLTRTFADGRREEALRIPIAYVPALLDEPDGRQKGRTAT